MEPLVKRINYLKKTEIGNIISHRMKHFKELSRKNDDEWFSELCFCLLTANSTAKLGISIQYDIGFDGFYNMTHDELSKYLKGRGHRFWNKRAEFIHCARKNRDVKNELSGIHTVEDKREWLVKNVKGIGYKEASHFLRNTGHDDVAILDRHILSIMHKFGMISERPKSLTRKRYLELEQKLKPLAKETNLSLAELDLYLWYMKTGEILK